MATRALPLPHLIDLGGSPRTAGLLDEVDTPPRALDAVRASLAEAPAGGRWLLCGGEPTTRPDLLTVIRASKAAGAGAVWVRTDGLALASKPACQALRKAGLDGVRVPMHSGRADAHDWLVGQPGAAKRVVRAIRTATAAGLAVEVEITLTRSTTPYLAETVALALRLGAAGIWLRRVRPQGAAAADFITISPRLGLIRASVEEAVRIAGDLGASLWVSGIPRCVVPGAAEQLCADGAAATPCIACPGAPACAGVPDEYTARFGWSEVWRLTPRQTRESVQVRVDPAEPTRAVRARMLRAAQLRPQRLRLVDVAEHPEALSLMRDALRLSVPVVEVCGLVSQLAHLKDTALFRLRGISRVDAAAATPEAVPALRALLERLHGDTRSSVYGLARSAAEVSAFEAAGADAARLLPGGTLSALRGALAAPHRPPCLGGGGAEPVPEEGPWKGQAHPRSDTDRRGDPLPCPLADRCAAAERCPGLAEGWSADGIQAIT